MAGLSVRRLITLRWPGTCVSCGCDLDPGTRAYWDESARTITCVGCITKVEEPVVHPANAGGIPVQVLKDRRLRGRRANIDQIAIGPGGVTVIDSKESHGKVRVVSTGGVIGPRRQELYIGHRRRTALVESVELQVEAIRLLLLEAGLPDIAVTGALCMTGDDELALAGNPKIRDITIDGPGKVAKLTERPGPLSPEIVKTITRTLERALPRA